MAAKGMQIPWRWTSGTISTNLGVIWGMPVDSFSRARADPSKAAAYRSISPRNFMATV